VRRTSFVIGAVLIGGMLAAGACLPAIGAGALLHPSRHVTTATRPSPCEDASFSGAGVTLKGWRCHAATQARGTIVYLHGIADNRGSAAGVIQRYTSRGFDVIAYDSRAHGESEGTACTYGFFEKQDLHRVVDAIATQPIILMGTSLGAAVALQEAADDQRVAAVISAETFSDLRTVASERAPGFFTRGTIERSFTRAEKEAGFDVDDVSPEKAASRITIPVLLIHGAADVETPPAHSERVRRALKGRAELILVPGAGHNHSLSGDVWTRIDAWIEGVADRFSGSGF
jgi:pimeloyl-ACP methyl ester carboxylesterase